MPKRDNPDLSSITSSEWDYVEQVAHNVVNQKLDIDPNFKGFIKINRKDHEDILNNSFRVYVEDGEIKHLFATARKKLVVGDRLGGGRFGVVASCMTRDGEIFAAKYQWTRIDKAQINNEMHLLNAVKDLIAHDFYLSKQGADRHFSVMKRKEGKELYEMLYDTNAAYSANMLLRRLQLTDTQKLVLAIKCLLWVEYLHAQNIVHRDLKPQNIMVNFAHGDSRDKMIVSLIDYGLSHQLKRNETMRDGFKAAGTPGYAAPEVKKNYFSPVGILSTKNDIYSLGFMFKDDFEMSDRFVTDHMLVDDYRNRYDARQCREHFEKELKKELAKELHSARPLLTQDELTTEVQYTFDELFEPDTELRKELAAIAEVQKAEKEKRDQELAREMERSRLLYLKKKEEESDKLKKEAELREANLKKKAEKENEFARVLDKVNSNNAIKELYNAKTTGSLSETKLLGWEIFKSSRRSSQIEAIQFFINYINTDGSCDFGARLNLLYTFAHLVYMKITAINPKSRLAAVMKDLTDDIKTNQKQFNIEYNEVDLNRYYSNLDKHNLKDGNALRELEFLCRGEAPSNTPKLSQ